MSVLTSVVGVDASFSAELFEWRGPAPFYWLSLPEDVSEYVREEAAMASYGWGAVPVRVRIGRTEWETSMLPRGGGYALPVEVVAPRTAPEISGKALTVRTLVR
jgi:hypothetical protein